MIAVLVLKDPFWNTKPPPATTRFALPAHFYKIDPKEFSRHAVPSVCPLSLSQNCSVDIELNGDTKIALCKVTDDLHVSTSNSPSRASSSLRCQQHWAQLNTPCFLHICPLSCSAPFLGVSSDLTGHPLSPIAVALISMTLKCQRVQDPVQGPLSFWPHLYTLLT